jgi:DnaJ-class molecular chaperone
VIRCLQLLGLPRSATASDLEAAFKSYVKRNHPDKVQDARERELAEQQFKQVSAAYTFLKGVGFGQEARAS